MVLNLLKLCPILARRILTGGWLTKNNINIFITNIIININLISIPSLESSLGNQMASDTDYHYYDYRYHYNCYFHWHAHGYKAILSLIILPEARSLR